MIDYLSRGIIIGIIFGLPIGAVGTMTAQRTLKYGVKAGLITGLGSSVADCLYACIGVLGLNFISDFLLKYQILINIIGGSFILFMGIRLIVCKTETINLQLYPVNILKTFLSSFIIGITNPTAILTFLFAFSYFGITKQTKSFQKISLVCGVFIGTYIWWGLLSFTLNIVKKKITSKYSNSINKIFGIFLILFGTIIFIKSLVMY